MQTPLDFVVAQIHVRLPFRHRCGGCDRLYGATGPKLEAPWRLWDGATRTSPLDEPIQGQQAVKIAKDEFVIDFTDWLPPTEENEDVPPNRS